MRNEIGSYSHFSFDFPFADLIEETRIFCSSSQSVNSEAAIFVSNKSLSRNNLNQ